MTQPIVSAETDSLATLEARVRQTAELVARLKRERDAATAAQQAAERDAAAARAQTARLEQDLEALRAERAQVRTRVEKLLEQIDALAVG